MKNPLLDREIAIIGYAETKIARRSGKTAYELAGEIMDQIAERTGVVPADIDGLATVQTHSEACNPFWAPFLGDHLGLSLNWTQTTGNGGRLAGRQCCARRRRDPGWAVRDGAVL
jgi:acetyl-CoA acetyltransferase